MAFTDTGLQKIKDKLENSCQGILLSQLGELLEPGERPHGKLANILRESGLEIKYGLSPAEIYACLPGQDIPNKKGAFNGLQHPVEKYRRAVLRAFTEEILPGKKICLYLYPKTKYEIINTNAELPEGAIPLDEEFRLPGEDLLHDPKSSKVNEFEKKLANWVTVHKVPMDRMLWIPFKKNIPDTHSTALHLLEDMVNAQLPELQSKIFIPCSLIAAILRVR